MTFALRLFKNKCTRQYATLLLSFRPPPTPRTQVIPDSAKMTHMSYSCPASILWRVIRRGHGTAEHIFHHSGSPASGFVMETCVQHVAMRAHNTTGYWASCMRCLEDLTDRCRTAIELPESDINLLFDWCQAMVAIHSKMGAKRSHFYARNKIDRTRTPCRCLACCLQSRTRLYADIRNNSLRRIWCMSHTQARGTVSSLLGGPSEALNAKPKLPFAVCKWPQGSSWTAEGQASAQGERDRQLPKGAGRQGVFRGPQHAAKC